MEIPTDKHNTEQSTLQDTTTRTHIKTHIKHTADNQRLRQVTQNRQGRQIQEDVQQKSGITTLSDVKYPKQ